jgi:DNA-binding NarL/FixJ family response regulator
MTLTTFGDFKRTFGELDPRYPLGYAVYDFFTNGGSQAVVVRLFRDPGAVAAAAVAKAAEDSADPDAAKVAAAAHTKAATFTDEPAKRAAARVDKAAADEAAKPNPTADRVKAAARAAADAITDTSSASFEPNANFRLKAAGPGEWGNKLFVAVDKDGITDDVGKRYGLSSGVLFNLSIYNHPTLDDKNNPTQPPAIPPSGSSVSARCAAVAGNEDPFCGICGEDLSLPSSATASARQPSRRNNRGEDAIPDGATAESSTTSKGSSPASDERGGAVAHPIRRVALFDSSSPPAKAHAVLPGLGCQSHDARRSVAGEGRVGIWIDDANAIFRRGLASCLTNKDFLVVGESCDLVPQPDLSAVKILIFSLDGLGLQRGLRLARDTSARLIGIARAPREQLALEGLQGGLAGFLVRSELTPDGLVSCVQAVAAGNEALPAAMLGRLMMSGLGKIACPGTSAGQLAKRELAVLRLLAEGGETRQIADGLCYSERTVKNIIHDVLVKMNCKTRAQAVAIATRRGFI